MKHCCAHDLLPPLLLLHQVRMIAAMLAPLLDVICNMPCLADPTVAAGVVASPLSAAVAAAGVAGSAGGVAGSSSITSNGSLSTGGVAPGPSGSFVAPAISSSSSGNIIPSSAAGAYCSSPVAAAAAALLQLRLLEVFFFLPAPQLWSNCHGQLLQLVCRQLMGSAGSRVRPGQQNAKLWTKLCSLAVY
jgi:hypothetical protein